MALADYRTYTQVCKQDKFPDPSLFEKPTEEDTSKFLTYKKERHESTCCNHNLINTHKYTLLTEDEKLTTIAIARLETGNFTSEAYVCGNNFGGLSVNEEPLAFETKEEGLDAFVTNLIDNYFSEGLHTPEEIGNKYCPVNPNWAELIKQLKEEGKEQWEKFLM